MASWTKDVFSSRVSQVGWDEDTQEIIVRWAKGGKTSAYSGADEETALRLANAASVGQMINQEIIPECSHRYV
jgi:hypothetical protein